MDTTLQPDCTLPYMVNDEAYNRLQDIASQLLQTIGEDVNREGLQETPRRFADFWREFINYQPGNTNTTFEAVTTNQMVVLSGIRVWSLCEHHLLPFWCDVSIGYIAERHVIGISKLARIAHKHAHKLQLQERLCHQIADEVTAVTQSDNVAVLARGVHTCMTMRGIRTDAVMSSSVMRGLFMHSEQTRLEFLRLGSQ